MPEANPVGWLGGAGERQIELRVPPDQFLKRIRKAAPPSFWEGGPLFAAAPCARVEGNAFALWVPARRNWGSPRLQGTIEASGPGSRIRFQVRPSVTAFLGPGLISLLLLGFPILNYSERNWPPSLGWYVFCVPAVVFFWLFFLFTQRRVARKTLDFFQQLIEDISVLAPSVTDKASAPQQAP